jgi:hypothetical protein
LVAASAPSAIRSAAASALAAVAALPESEASRLSDEVPVLVSALSSLLSWVDVTLTTLTAAKWSQVGFEPSPDGSSSRALYSMTNPNASIDRVLDLYRSSTMDDLCAIKAAVEPLADRHFLRMQQLHQHQQQQQQQQQTQQQRGAEEAADGGAAGGEAAANDDEAGSSSVDDDDLAMPPPCPPPVYLMQRAESLNVDLLAAWSRESSVGSIDLRLPEAEMRRAFGGEMATDHLLDHAGEHAPGGSELLASLLRRSRSDGQPPSQAV